MDLDQLAAAAVLARGRGVSMSKGVQKYQSRVPQNGRTAEESDRREFRRSTARLRAQKLLGKLKDTSDATSPDRGSSLDEGTEAPSLSDTITDEIQEWPGQRDSMIKHDDLVVDSAAASALQAFTSGVRSSSSLSTYHSNYSQDHCLPPLTFGKGEGDIESENAALQRDGSSDSSTAHSTPECSSSFRERLFHNQLLGADTASLTAVIDADEAAAGAFACTAHSSVLPQKSYDFDIGGALHVPGKKQKGRRPAAAGMELKNHKCPHLGCAWSFSRREHLKRHEKTHTQERPFTCDVPLCGLKFSRLDNLNSHKRTHEKGKRTAQWHVAKVVGTSVSPMESAFPHLQIENQYTLTALPACLSQPPFLPSLLDKGASMKRKRAPLRAQTDDDNSTSPELDDDDYDYPGDD